MTPKVKPRRWTLDDEQQFVASLRCEEQVAGYLRGLRQRRVGFRGEAWGRETATACRVAATRQLERLKEAARAPRTG